MPQTVGEGSGASTVPSTGNGWDYWEFDPATGRWTSTRQSGQQPQMRTECHYGPDGKLDCRSVPVNWSPSTTGTGTGSDTPAGPEMTVGKNYAENIASHYATVGGHDVYVETEAERLARESGLARDANGFYQLVNGKKVYSTGMDPETGRRFHYLPNAPLDPFTGERSMEEGVGIVWDDPGEFVTHGSKADLEAQRRAAQDRLEQLRQQYKNARSDAWVVKNNLLVRIRDTEDEITAINRVLGEDPVPEVTHTVSGNVDNKFKGGVRVAMSFAIDEPGQELSFSDTLSTIPNGAYVVARADIAFGDRSWTPGRLMQPDMCRVDWEVPQAWTAIDAAPASTDEFICSNPLTIMRDFIAPSTGNTFVGKGTESVFKVKASVYELVIDENKIPEEWRREGDDGYTGGVIVIGDTPSSQLAAFMHGLGHQESGNNPTAHNRHSDAWGEWQIMPTNWENWSREMRRQGLLTFSGHEAARTPENSEAIATWRISKMYRGRQSWRRTANAWHKGPGWERHHPDHLGTYASGVLEAAGLPVD